MEVKFVSLANNLTVPYSSHFDIDLFHLTLSD